MEANCGIVDTRLPASSLVLFNNYISSIPSRSRFTDSKYERFTAYLRDPDSPMALRGVQAGTSKHLSRLYLLSNYSLSQGGHLQRRIITKEKVILLRVVRESEMADLIWKVHCEIGHAGTRKTFERIQYGYYGVNRMEVRKLISLCEVCRQRCDRINGIKRKRNGQFDVIGEKDKTASWLSWDNGDEIDELDVLLEEEVQRCDRERSKASRTRSLSPPVSKIQSPAAANRRSRSPIGKSIERRHHPNRTVFTPVREMQEGDDIGGDRNSSSSSPGSPTTENGLRVDTSTTKIDILIQQKVKEAVGEKFAVLEGAITSLGEEQEAVREWRSQVTEAVYQIEETLRESEITNLLSTMDKVATWLLKLDTDVRQLKEAVVQMEQSVC